MKIKYFILIAVVTILVVLGMLILFQIGVFNSIKL